MKKILPLVFSIVIVFPLFSQNENPIIVTVNGYEITNTEVNYELSQLEQQAMIAGEQQKTPLNYANIEKLRNTVIGTLINKQLLLQECSKRNVAVSDSTIELNLQELRNQFPTKQQYHDFLAHSSISEIKLQEEIRIAISIDLLANQELEQQGKSVPNISAEDKQAALAKLLYKLHEEAEIIRYE
ncbi:MAG TPA: hypothetical protein DCO79_02010 [Spirochaeta sp.]|nr:hypothetical protein [Spirochaeta sp.]